MSMLSHVLGFFGLHAPARERPKRHLVLVQHDAATDAMAAEVDNERQRYSAERYIDHMLACEGGDRTGFREWSMYLLRLQAEQPDAYAHFMSEVDALMESGRWHTVLTPEDKAKAAAAAYAKRFEILEGLERVSANGMKARDANDATTVVFGDDPDAPGLPAWPELGDDDE